MPFVKQLLFNGFCNSIEIGTKTSGNATKKKTVKMDDDKWLSNEATDNP